MSETRNQGFVVISFTLFFSILLMSASWVYCVDDVYVVYDDGELLKFYWNPPTIGKVAYYDVYLSTNGAGYVQIETTPNATLLTPYTINASYGNTYRLKIQAKDAKGNFSKFVEADEVVICKQRSPGDINGDIKGDADGDLRVGAGDWAMLCASWKKGCGVNSSSDDIIRISRADFNYDGIVNILDRNVISGNLGYDKAITNQTPQNPVVSSGSSFKVRLTAPQNLKAGEEAIIEIVAEGVEDLYAMDFEVSFDPAVIKIEDIQKGTFFSGIKSNQSDKTLKAELATEPSWIAGKINQSPGRISPTLVAVPLGDVSGRSGDGVIASIKIVAKSGGISTISLKNINAYDSKLNSIIVKNFDSVLKIEAVKNILEQNYPNPFNPETWIPYAVAKEYDNVSITIYNSLGQEVRRLELGQRSAGFYTSKDRAAYWDGKNNNGTLVASGVYFYQIKAGNFSSIKKMVVLK